MNIRDNQQFTLPEKSVPIYAYKKVNLRKKGEERKDGRQYTELRPMFINREVVKGALGSAFVEMNNTKVICAIYGPRQVLSSEQDDDVLKGRIVCRVRYSTFSQRSRQNNEVLCNELSEALFSAIEPVVIKDKFPKACYEIYVTILEDDGSAYAAAINAASVALTTTGIEMYDILTGCTMKYSDGEMLYDPTLDEEMENRESSERKEGAILTIALLPNLKQISNIMMVGDISLEAMQESFHHCMSICQSVRTVIEQTTYTYIKEKLKYKQENFIQNKDS